MCNRRRKLSLNSLHYKDFINTSRRLQDVNEPYFLSLFDISIVLHSLLPRANFTFMYKKIKNRNLKMLLFLFFFLLCFSINNLNVFNNMVKNKREAKFECTCNVIYVILHICMYMYSIGKTAVLFNLPF